ncbi:presqualene diphosphate synthase HpnD [Ectothiorhodospiraceae bacterium 2226]|nr:presqualene diphosphate synthase HpnD [Ectothiorhodospiraceae bacterium 2226]
MTPEQYCQDKAARSGSSFYYSFLFLDPEQRRAITALYAFCREVDDVVDECREEAVARVKLQWWREEVDRLYEGAPRHPVTRALAPHLPRFELDREHMLEMIDGMEMDLEQNRYADFKALSLYCYRAASVVGLMSAQIFGYEDRRTLKYAHDLGIAFQLTNILRDVREDAARGRIYLPQDELARFGVREADILRYRHTPELEALLRFQAERAERYYERAFDQLPEADRARQRAGIIMARIYRETLDAVIEDGLRVMERRVMLTPLRKLWLAWQTVWRERRRHRRWLAAQRA